MRYFVRETEFDRFSGHETLSITEFDNKDEAEDFVESVNSKNTQKTVPDYYVVANIETDISLSEYERFIGDR